MLGFGLASVTIFLGKDWFDRHWEVSSGAALIMFGPFAVMANLLAQLVPFNAIFLISDPDQKWRLLANFLLYLLPFLSGAFFLGIVFRHHSGSFNRIYFADLIGSGLAGLVILGAMYVLPPEHLLVAPLLLWSVATVFWFAKGFEWKVTAGTAVISALVIAVYLAAPVVLSLPDLAVSQYKGVAYARNFPDARRIYRSVSPFGDLQVYASSYMHFAPGLSDNAAFNVPEIPANTYVGMFVDGDGPEGIMRALPPADSSYFHYLPTFYPYVLKQHPRVFIVQFGGGLSTVAALNAGAQSVTVAENNPDVLLAFRAPSMRAATGDLLSDSRVQVIDYEGRLFLAHTSERYDVIDLSLADSVGLSNPGGFAITEKYAYTEEAVLSYMRALADGGILSITLWNKEEPPKSVLKLYATVAEAVGHSGDKVASSLFVSASYLSTTTVLYKKGGFSADEVLALREHTAALSFDEIYSPGFAFDPASAKGILDQYHASIFGDGGSSEAAPGIDAGTEAPAGAVDATQGTADTAVDPTGSDSAPPLDEVSTPVPSTTLGRLVWHDLSQGSGNDITGQYVFDARPLTNDRPYFAAYVRPADLTKTLDRLDTIQDDWGYLLLWATFGIAGITAASLVILPLIFGWRSGLGRSSGKLGTVVYFGCLGLGYIVVEVGLISRFTLALSNPTISAALVISGMLVFSGVGSFVAERIIDRAKTFLPLILAGIVLSLAVYATFLSPLLDWIGSFPYAARVFLCGGIVAPPAFLMGFPMATAMTWLGRLGRDQMFVWAWGINGCFSVIGAAAVPLIAVNFGLAAVLELSAAAYLLAIPAFIALMVPTSNRFQRPAR